MKRRIARKIFNAFYSFKPNYWNGYKGFTLCSFFACKNPRLQHALNIAYKYEKRYAPIPTKPIAYKVVLPIRHPRKYYFWNNI